MARLRRLYGVAGLTSVLALAAGPALADYLEDARAIADAAKQVTILAHDRLGPLAGGLGGGQGFPSLPGF